MYTESIIFLVLILMLAGSSIKVARENERFVLYRLGRFFGLKGPGLIIVIPVIDKCTKINVGDRGELLAQGLARIANVDIPVTLMGRFEIGKTVRIQSFMEREAVVVADSESGLSGSF